MAKKKATKKKKQIKQIDSENTVPKITLFRELKQMTWTKPKELAFLVAYTIILGGVLSGLMYTLDIFFGGLRDALVKLFY